LRNINWLYICFISIILSSGYKIVLKSYAHRLSYKTHMIYFNIMYIFVGLILGIIYFFQNGFVYTHTIWVSFFAGVLSAIGGVTYFIANTKAPGSTMQPLTGMCIPIGGILCLIFLKEPITPKVICGIASVVITIYLFSSN